jgi:hypothetical protein
MPSVLPHTASVSILIALDTTGDKSNIPSTWMFHGWYLDAQVAKYD